MSQPHRPLWPRWIPWIMIAAGSAVVGEAMDVDATDASFVVAIIIMVVVFAVADDSWPEDGGGSPPPRCVAVVGVVLGRLLPRLSHRVHLVQPAAAHAAWLAHMKRGP